MFLCRQRLFLVGPPSEIFGAKKGGAAFLFVLRAYGCRSTCWSRKRRIFRRLEFLFVCFFEKKNVPNPMSKLMQPSPAYPIPSLMSSPRSSLRPPTPHHTTNIHQPPTFRYLQSHPPIHPAPTRYRSTRRSSSSARPPAKPRRMPLKASRICRRMRFEYFSIQLPLQVFRRLP